MLYKNNVPFYPTSPTGKTEFSFTFHTGKMEFTKTTKTEFRFTDNRQVEF